MNRDEFGRTFLFTLKYEDYRNTRWNFENRLMSQMSSVYIFKRKSHVFVTMSHTKNHIKAGGLTMTSVRNSYMVLSSFPGSASSPHSLQQLTPLTSTQPSVSPFIWCLSVKVLQPHTVKGTITNRPLVSLSLSAVFPRLGMSKLQFFPPPSLSPTPPRLLLSHLTEPLQSHSTQTFHLLASFLTYFTE